jgi:hypothetical protein
MEGTEVWLAAAAMVCAAAVKTGPGSAVGAVANGKLQASAARPKATTTNVLRADFAILPPKSNNYPFRFLLDRFWND